jgi:hypothetical protein
MDGSFIDWGTIQGGSFNPAVVAAYVPRTPPPASTNGYLQTTITAINGTSVTLANAASATVTSGTVLHDNAANVINACTSAANNSQGGTIYFPGSNPQGNLYILNSPLRMASCPGSIRLMLGAPLAVNEPVLVRNQMLVEGLPQGATNQFPSFNTGYSSEIQGNAYPFFLLTPGASQDSTFVNLNELCNQRYQSCTVIDQDSTGNNVTTVTFTNVYQSGSAGSIPFRMGGGFGFYFTGGAVAGSGGTGWGAPPVFLNSVQQGLGLNGQQLAGILYMDKTQLDGEMLFDAGGLFPLLSGPGHFEIKEMLTESVNTAVMRFNTGNNTAGNIVIINPTMADQTGGQATPMYDFTNAQSVAGITFNNPSCNSGPLVAAGPNLFFEYNSSPFAGCGAGMSG